MLSELQVAQQHYVAGRMAEAEEHLRRLLEREPDNVQALSLLGAIRNQLGKPQEAVELFEKAAAAAPGNPTVLNNLGVVLRELGRPADAERRFRAALSSNPGFQKALGNLGSLALDHGRFDEAQRYYQEALAQGGGHAEAHNGLGAVASARGNAIEAESHYRRALATKPDYADACSNLGNLLLNAGRLEEAAAVLEQALRSEPSHAGALVNLGNVETRSGRPEQAVRRYRRALELKPDLEAAHSNLIFALDLLESSDTRQQQQERQRWYVRHAQKYSAQIQAHPNPRDPERRLRVGYVSADFRRHSAYYAFSPVIVGQDRAAFEVFCYYNDTREDDATERLRKSVQNWRSIAGLSDNVVAEQIRADRIDILVDLAGHSAGNRLLVFARKPAPVQVTAWGYATGTGVRTIDYFLADPLVVPPPERALFAEQVIDLPCIVCYQPPDYLPAVSELPSLAGAPLTYGFVNRLEKVTDRVVEHWGQILRNAPNARLLLKDKPFSDARVKADFLKRFREITGVDSARLVLHGASPHAEHLEIFNQIDIGLDPFPHGGGISTAEALCMGVPVVALIGQNLTSRITPSLLDRLQMNDWVAHSSDEYVRIALDAGRDLKRLAQLRQTLRNRVRASPFGDVAGYTRAVEQTYREMWRRWCGAR